jgi:hypothetical protein
MKASTFLYRVVICALRGTRRQLSDSEDDYPIILK